MWLQRQKKLNFLHQGGKTRAHNGTAWELSTGRTGLSLVSGGNLPFPKARRCKKVGPWNNSNRGIISTLWTFCAHLYQFMLDVYIFRPPFLCDSSSSIYRILLHVKKHEAFNFSKTTLPHISHLGKKCILCTLPVKSTLIFPVIYCNSIHPSPLNSLNWYKKVINEQQKVIKKKKGWWPKTEK